MRVTHASVASVLLMALAFAQPCKAIDWNAFDDPAAILLTDEFAKSIADLPASEKAAATKRLLELLDDRDLRGPAIQALEVLANHKFGNDPEKWKSWWNDRAQ